MPAREKSDRPKLNLHHTPIEIERKFLVANDAWRRSVVGSIHNNMFGGGAQFWFVLYVGTAAV
jgi:hypothetical protein